MPFLDIAGCACDKHTRLSAQYKDNYPSNRIPMTILVKQATGFTSPAKAICSLARRLTLQQECLVTSIFHIRSCIPLFLSTDTYSEKHDVLRIFKQGYIMAVLHYQEKPQPIDVFYNSTWAPNLCIVLIAFLTATVSNCISILIRRTSDHLLEHPA